MTTIFFTKKQKKLMRERRRKKKTAERTKRLKPQGDDVLTTELEKAASSSKKRPLPSQQVVVSDYSSHDKSSAATPPTTASVAAVAKNERIVIPAHLSGKEARKFRKDARRQARAEGRDAKKLVFVVEGKHTNHDKEEPVKKKRKRSFPRINELVEQEKKEREKRLKEERREQEEAALSDEHKTRYVALDCEMVGIGSDGKKSVLARVSITDWNGKTLLDTFVQVPGRVTDFRTHVSGVRPKNLKGSHAMEVSRCRETVASLLKDKILVGHALKNDLDALMLQHPKQNTRDTAKYRPFQRYGGNKWRPRKLRDLVKENLDLVIQEEGQSHDSVDDARATMELFKLVRSEWEQEMQAKAAKRKK